MGEPDVGVRALLAARAWLGTPYRHGASVQGQGCDCLGLVRGVWRALYGAEPQAIPAYRPDWAETGGPETLLDAARRWFEPRPLAAAAPGDVVLFRMAPDACVKHCAILSVGPGAGGEGRVIHAYWGRAVVESWLGPWWRARLHSAWAWPVDPAPPGKVAAALAGTACLRGAAPLVGWADGFPTGGASRAEGGGPWPR